MIYTIPIRDPELGYLDRWLWLPKSRISVEVLKNSLMLPIQSGGGEEIIQLWRDSPDHLGIPRARLPLDHFDFPIIDLRPSSYESIDVQSNLVLDARRPEMTDQKEAFEDLVEGGDGILNLACGRGKTCIALHAVARWGVPALIINDKIHILEQWRGEINTHLRVNGEIGWVQGKPEKWVWEDCPIVLATLKTLATYRNELPPGFKRRFGTIIWDEAHHLGARDYSKTADLFPGRRIGLTATINRADGAEMIYLWHIGMALHSNLKQDVTPSVVFLRSPARLDMDDSKIFDACTDKRGELHYKRLAICLGGQPAELAFEREVIDEGIRLGRDMLVASTSREHARRLHEMYPSSGIIDKDVPANKRLSMLREHKLTFGTIDMAQEALNKTSLNSLIILTEFTSDRILTQSMGRIQRFLENKRSRVIVVFHHRIPYLAAMGRKLMRRFKQQGIEVEVK